MIQNLLVELRARLAFGETSDLSNIEEQGAQCVACVRVEGLQTAPEPGVAVTVRPATSGRMLWTLLEGLTTDFF